MKKFIFYGIFFMALVFAMLTGCSKKNDAQKEVDHLVKTVEGASQASQKKEVDTKEIIKTYVYDAHQSRDPFEEPLASRRQGKQYENAILRDVALDSLKLIGIVIHDHFRFALFRANDGQLYKVSVGMHVGIEGSLLTRIDENQVVFVQEAGATNTGTSTREIVMHMQEPKP